MVYDVIIIGGGASGFFTAINYAERCPNKKVLILERSKNVLSKVRISGGGRCNVTHADFIPHSLVKNYPRGERELLSPFHQFMTGDTMEWFENRGVSLKIEEDGRVFPQSDSSQSIIDCFMREVKRLSIELQTRQPVQKIKKKENWQITTPDTDYQTKNIVIATGSNPKIWSILEELKHTIIPPVPSLFTFHCKDKQLNQLSGIALNANIEIIDYQGTPIKNKNIRIDKGGVEGSVLITHQGFSGPAILKLSAISARYLHSVDYKFYLRVNWLPQYTQDKVFSHLEALKKENGRKKVANSKINEIPKNLWLYMIQKSEISVEENWANINKKQLLKLLNQLTNTSFKIEGKATFKEEFITAGGVCLKEINFKTFESKICPNLYIVGEALDIDAVTGGFNFQNAWTSGYIAAKAIE